MVSVDTACYNQTFDYLFQNYYSQMGMHPAMAQQTYSSSPNASSSTFPMSNLPSNQNLVGNNSNFSPFPSLSSVNGQFVDFGRSSTERNKRRHTRDDTNSDAPKRKIHVTEEKMAARLRNFHISNKTDFDPSWFFIQKQPETLQEIDDRDDDEMRGEGSERPKTETTDRTTIELSKDLKDFLNAKRDERLLQPLYPQPGPCMDIVLWQPKNDFIRKLLPEQETQVSSEPYVTLPETPTDEFPADFRRTRRRRRFVAGPVIEEVFDDDDKSKVLVNDDESSMDVDVDS